MSKNPRCNIKQRRYAKLSGKAAQETHDIING